MFVAADAHLPVPGHRRRSPTRDAAWTKLGGWLGLVTASRPGTRRSPASRTSTVQAGRACRPCPRWQCRSQDGVTSDALRTCSHEDRRFEPPAELAAHANVDGPTPTTRPTPDRLAFWAKQAERLTWARAVGRRSSTGATRRSRSGSSAASSTSPYNCVDRHVEAGHGDQVAFHWEGEPGRHPHDHLRRAQGRGLPGGQRADRARRAGRRPGRDLHADDPRDGRRDAGLRPASARRTPWCSAASPPTRCATGSSDCDAAVVITADGGYRRGAPSRAQARRRRGARRSAPTSATCSSSRRTGQDVDWTEGRDVWWHDVVDRQSTEHDARGVRRRAPALRHVHLRHDRQAEGHPAHHRRLPRPGASYTHWAVFDLKPETDVYWCAADIGWVTGHCYIVYGPLANGATSVMYEGTPDTPHKGRWWEIIEKYKVTILYTRADRDPHVHEVGRGDPGAASTCPRCGCSARSASRSTPRPASGTARTSAATAARRRHLVADRDRRDHDQPAARRHRRQARLGDDGRCPGISADVVDDDGQAGRRTARGGYLVLTEPWPAMLRTHLGRRRAVQGHLLVALRRAGSTSPATARRRTRTATSGCSAGSTT